MEANKKLRKEKKNTGVTACPMETSKTTSSFLFIGRVLSAVVFSIVSFGADDVCDEGKKKWDKKKGEDEEDEDGEESCENQRSIQRHHHQ